MFKKIFSVLLLISGFYFFQSQIQLSGNVSQLNTGNPLVSAKVTLLKPDKSETAFSVRTENDGSFQISGITLCEFFVKVTFGNSKQILPVKVQPKENSINLGKIELYVD